MSVLSIVLCLLTQTSWLPRRSIWDFELSPSDMEAISGLNVGWRHLLWAETSIHPDYPFKDWLPYGYKPQKPGAGTTAGAK